MNKQEFLNGQIVIYNDNCLNHAPFQQDCILVSDPPYNINYHYDKYKDNLSDDEYYELLNIIFGNKQHVLIHYHESLYKHAYTIGDFPDKIVSWVYNSNTAKQSRGIAFFNVKPDFSKGEQDYKNPNDKRIREKIEKGKKAKLYDWWQINQVKNVSKKNKDINHPCVIPLEIMNNIIKIIPNKLIIDPFCGSGSTAIACLKNQRKFIGYEIDPKYFDLSCKRIEEELKQGNLF
jgi:DNA modification methylase